MSAEHLDRRRTQVLRAAARRFAVTGFHATSMADVIAESELSAGAVYRYFASKDDLITAVAQEAFTSAEILFEGLFADGAAPTPHEVIAQYLQLMDKPRHDGLDLGALLLQAWAESLHTDATRKRAVVMMTRIRELFTEVVRRRQAAGALPADLDPDVLGSAVLALAQGLLVQQLLLGSPPPAVVLKSLDAAGALSR